MSRLKRNVTSNFVGTLWSVVLNLACVPIYIRLLGIEAYGLIGFFASMQIALNLLDMGLSPTMNRQMAYYSAHPEQAQTARDLVRTLEVGYWGLGLVIGCGIVLLSPLIAEHWVKPDVLSTQVVQQSIAIMGLVAACQWPVSFYAGGLQGLQRQVRLNIVNVVMITLRNGGAVFIVMFISPSILAFFTWQIVTSTLNTTLLTIIFWKHLPPSAQSPRIRPVLLKSIWRFTAGVSGIAVNSIILTQADKLILSAMLPLAAFGYYMIANQVAQALTLVSGPITNAVFPRFTQLVSTDERSGIAALFHLTCQVVNVVAFSIGLVVALFAKEILAIWTRSDAVVQQAHLPVTLLVIGSIFLVSQTAPYYLALANGWTKLNFYLGTVVVITIIPLLILLARDYGAVGASAVWIIVNSVPTPLYIHLLLKRCLPGEERRWYLNDVGLPLIGALVPVTIGRLLIGSSLTQFSLMFSLISVSALTLLASAAAAPGVRSLMVRQICKLTGAPVCLK